MAEIGEPMMPVDEAFLLVAAQRGISTKASFTNWRHINDVPAFQAVRVADVERALRDGSGTKRKPRGRV